MNTTKGINSLIQEFIEESDISKASAETYKRTLAVFVTWLVQHGDILNPTRAEIIRFKAHLIDSKKEVLTIDSYLKVVILFFKFCTFRGYIDQNPALGISRPQRYKGHRKGSLTSDEVGKLLLMDNTNLIDNRNYAIVNLMVRTGLRCIEISHLNVEDILTTNTGYALRLQRKGHISKDSILGVTAKSVEPIENYLALRGEFNLDDPLFETYGYYSKSKRLSSFEVGRIVTAQLIKSGLKSKRITPHSLRHTFATTALKEGIPVWDLSVALGHASVNTTNIYASSIEAERMQTNPAINAIDSAY